MKFLENKTLKILIIILLSFPLMIQGKNIEIAHAKAPFGCADLMDPTKTKGWIITITEENISNATDTIVPGSGGAVGDQNVLNCFRVSIILSAGAGQTMSEYSDTCIPDRICQRVQVILAQSGAELLYTYVGLIYKWAAGTIGIVSVFFMVVGGVEISIAQGDQGRTDKAKTRITQSLAGLVILFLSALLLYTINPNFFTLT